MKVRDLERELAARTPWRPSEIDQRTRRLREAGMLPVGGYGRHAPNIEPQHAALVLAAMAAAETAPRTVEAATTLLALAPYGAPRDFLGCKSFGEALAVYLGNGQLADAVARIIVCRSWPAATIVYIDRNGAELAQHYGYPTAAVALAAGVPAFGVREDVTMDQGFLHALAVPFWAAAEEKETGRSRSGWGLPVPASTTHPK